MEIGAFEAKNQLSRLLERAERGEEIVITRRGKPVARLVPFQGMANREKAQEAVRRMRARARAKDRGPFDWEEWKKYRDEGRP
jgi:prevent-host-death family protein